MKGPLDREGRVMEILIAEDDPTSRRMLQTVLEKQSYQVVVACDGAEALKVMARPDAPQMALLDWEMPGLDGPEVCEALRAKPEGPRPYLIMLTGRKGGKDLVRGLEAGADDYVTKPFEAPELRARINAGVQILELQRRLAAKIDDLQEALARVRTLEGIVPICMHCKRIRDTDNYWQQVEVYVSAGSKAEFSHGLCDECMAEHYPPDDAEDAPIE